MKDRRINGSTNGVVSFLTILILCCLFFCVSRIYPPRTQQARIAGDLIELRNKSVFAFLMFNALFVLIVFLLQLNKDQLHVVWPLGVKTNITYVEETSEVSDDQESRQGKRRCHWDIYAYIYAYGVLKSFSMRSDCSQKFVHLVKVQFLLL